MYGDCKEVSEENDEKISQMDKADHSTQKPDESIMLEVHNFSEEDVLSVVDRQFNDIVKLEKEVSDALKKAEEAKKSADEISSEKVRLFRKHKDNIEHLQDAVSGIGDALVSSAEASKMLFEYMTRLTKATSYLFRIGIENIAATECVFRQLEAKLKGSAPEELSAMAKQELLSVIMRLKQHQSMMAKQEKLSSSVREIKANDKRQDEAINKIEEIDKQQERKIGENAERIGENSDRITVHQKELENQKIRDEELEQQLAKNAQDDLEQDEKLNFLSKQLDDANKKITELEEKLTALKINKWKIILCVGVSISLLLDLLQLLGIL